MAEPRIVGVSHCAANCGQRRLVTVIVADVLPPLCWQPARQTLLSLTSAFNVQFLRPPPVV